MNTETAAALDLARRVLRTEAAAILGLVDRIDGEFERAVQLLFECRGRVIVTGVGKSVVFGALVTLIGCYNGLATEGGTEGLGRSTTATVVQVAMGVIISDFFITKLFLIMFW